jgi:hypothetical protein
MSLLPHLGATQDNIPLEDGPAVHEKDNNRV